MSVSSLRDQGLLALQKGDNQAAILAADAMIRQHPDGRPSLATGSRHLFANWKS